MLVTARRCLWVLFATIVGGALSAQGAAGTPGLRDWELEAGFALERDSLGFALPVQLAFVPEPGRGPSDPLYYVVELRGTVKVVTNDRKVHTFAEGLTNYRPPPLPAEHAHELLAPHGEGGAAGLCLDPATGYVFVTYAVVRGGTAFNEIRRYATKPTTFALQPTAEKTLDRVFAGELTRPDHQIGSCAVHEGHLYVGIGDANEPHLTQDLAYAYGKILRLDLDGEPAPDNPFFKADGPLVTNAIWARGFRNPYGLRMVDGRLLVCDNGPGQDRFLTAERGENYLFDGSDWSIGTRAAFVFTPAVSPTTLDVCRAAKVGFPTSYDGAIFIALSGHPSDPAGPGENLRKTIVTFGYDQARGRVTSVPRPFLRYAGTGRQLLVGLAFGPDGLYFAPAVPDQERVSAIYKIRHAPDREHPRRIAFTDPEELLRQKSCYACHKTDGAESIGPSLRQGDLAARLDERLRSPAYLAQLAELDARADDPPAARNRRREVLAATGPARSQLWVKHHLLDPRFDNPKSVMPNMQLTDRDATILSRYLVPHEEKSFTEEMTERFGKLRFRHLVVAFGAGGGLMFVLMVAWRWLRRRRASG